MLYGYGILLDGILEFSHVGILVVDVVATVPPPPPPLSPPLFRLAVVFLVVGVTCTCTCTTCGAGVK